MPQPLSDLLLSESVLLVELLDTALSLCESLTSGVERMAVGAGINLDFLQGGSCFKFRTAARADNLALVVLRMDVLLHVRLLPSCLKPLCVLKESASII